MNENSIPGTYLVKLKARQEVAENTVAFYFERPTGFSFKAGQFLDLELLHPPETDSKGNTRAFTIASAPSEDHLMVVTRLRDTSFKQVLTRLPLDSPVNIEGPFGTLILSETMTKPLVFLAGGIGITPFRSMLVQAVHDQLPNRIYLFYTNRRPEDAAFLEELHTRQETHPLFTLIPIMTQSQLSLHKWTGETGYCDGTMLKKYLDDIQQPHYYVVGPPKMVEGMKSMLSEAGIVKTQFRSEKFSGY
ncbi:FAD-dependent oxidoreductase [Candidatus Nitronereus thalassa]|uniref:FAD-dependent oxidoreductase n=1 Tax=Candidatus Nitronereus thalassa TaxID=3020898 RepID=A0ABU3K9X3_9BACT|nr:FAD-dependent oxidoreductase [Candidatus Nitronereus thalassa]MDT7043212.1 FAD-dependent oxidoreductase [Candidatus Nitronereus thalassa]